MNQEASPNQTAWAVHFPALAKLHLTLDDVTALQRQGLVVHETRRGKPLYRLRFRRAGRQHARYIAGSEQAKLVRLELAVLQRQRRKQLQIARLQKAARVKLREARSQLAGVLPPGYRLHGHAVRKLRTTIEISSQPEVY